MEQDVAVIEVRPGGRRRIDRVLDPGYVRGLDALSLKELRGRRDEAAQEETDLSYLRRLLHARIDIVRAEQERRSTGGQRSIVDQLAAILSDNALRPARGSGRHQALEPSRAGEHRRQAEALVGNTDLSDVGALSDDKLAGTLHDYTEEEASVSTRRREVQAVVDMLNAEIAARYARGAASVDDLLAAERARDD
jgi:anti-sigma-K factor RsiG